jgi:hypothetical protein
MIDLPDYGYASCSIVPIDPGGVAPGSLGGPDDVVPRPGYRYSANYSTGLLSTSVASLFEEMLEEASRDDASYPWPLDFKPSPAGSPVVSASSPAGAVIPISGLTPGYTFRKGQPIAVISGGVGYVHKVSASIVASSGGAVTLAVFPWTRTTFASGDVIEIERPRIRGDLQFQPPLQGPFGKRAFSFTIRERL